LTLLCSESGGGGGATLTGGGNLGVRERFDDAEVLWRFWGRSISSPAAAGDEEDDDGADGAVCRNGMGEELLFGALFLWRSCCGCCIWLLWG